MKCKFCNYEWEIRATKPKQCPLCKRYLITPNKRKDVQNDDTDMPKTDGTEPEPIKSENGNPSFDY